MKLEQVSDMGNLALQVGLYITIGVGAAMVLMPNLTIQFFGLLIYQEPNTILSWPEEAQLYVKLAHAVMGSVMMGWAALMLLVSSQKRRAENSVIKLISASLIIWYLPDTLASLFYGFWQNAVFNTGFLLMLMFPLYLPLFYKSKSNSLTGAP